jgi:hypothetical protein
VDRGRRNHDDLPQAAPVTQEQPIKETAGVEQADFFAGIGNQERRTQWKWPFKGRSGSVRV